MFHNCSREQGTLHDLDFRFEVCLEAGDMATRAVPEQRQAEETMLADLQEMLRQGDVPGARDLVTQLLRQWPEAAWVKHYAHVLAPPRARLRQSVPAPSHDREYAWLQKNAASYPGCWLAVLDEQLIAADANFSAVARAVRQMEGAERALLYFQPRTDD